MASFVPATLGVVTGMAGETSPGTGTVALGTVALGTVALGTVAPG